MESSTDTSTGAPAGSSSDTPADPPAGPRPRRLAGLDGLRGIAALFVVIHHCYLAAFPQFPAPAGPWWTFWMPYGHFAVVVFIVLSGFSLAVSPARAGWKLDSVRKFARRRAWRILPPYWPALVFSLIVAWAIVPQPGEGTPTGKSVVLYGLLLQDVSGSPSPNGAFWSIAVEAQLYFFFPLLLLLLKRYSTALMLGGVGIVVAAIGLLSPHVHAVDQLNRFTPQFALLFATGIAAAGVVRSDAPRWPWFRLAAIAAVPPLVLLVLAGQKWSVTHLFWVDLALAPTISLLLAAIATGRPSPLVRVLGTRPLRSLGSFSYSLYLIHAPLVVVLSEKVVAPHVAHGTPALLATLALAVPISLLSARLFAAVFEIPFTRHRSWGALKEALRPAPVATPEMAPVSPE